VAHHIFRLERVARGEYEVGLRFLPSFCCIHEGADVMQNTEICVTIQCDLTRACVCVCMYVCMYVLCMYLCMYVSMYVCVCVA